MSFGACIANLTAPNYHFRNGTCLVVSDVTMKSISAKEKTTDILLNGTPTLKRTQLLLNFEHFDKPKTGENIGAWLDDNHRGVGCRPDYINSHIVDSAANAVKSVEELQWFTDGERSQPIISELCDAHKANTSGKQASGTSAHKVNLNPNSGAMLTKNHDWHTLISSNGACKGVVKNVQQEHYREKCARNGPAVVTRWGSSHQETRATNINQFDLEVSIDRILAPGGVYEKLRRAKEDSTKEKSTATAPTEDEWDFYQQYESGLEPMTNFITFSQSAVVVVHEELFEARMALEKLRSPWFTMYENVSKKTGPRGAKDLTVRIGACYLLY